MKKSFFVGLIIWILLQISRFIALILIDDINAGAESKAWMYSAYLDLFAAILALPLIIRAYKMARTINLGIYYRISSNFNC